MQRYWKIKKYLPLCTCSNQSTSILYMPSSVLVGVVRHFKQLKYLKMQAYTDSGMGS